MSEPFNEGSFQETTVEDNGQPPVAPDNSQQPAGINPAWNPLLEQLPTSLHGMVTPHLSTWDKNVQQMVQKVHSEYEPWKQFRENNIDPNMAYQSWQAIQNLEQDPEAFVQAVIQHYGIQLASEQGQQQPEIEEGEEDLEDFDITQHPEFQRVTGMTEQMAQVLLAQHQQQQDAAMDAQLDNDINQAKQKFGDFDEDYVLQRMSVTGEDIGTAVQNFIQFRDGLIQQSRNPSAGAPIIMGSGGGTPQPTIPGGNLAPQDRRALIAQTLANAAQNGG